MDLATFRNLEPPVEMTHYSLSMADFSPPAGLPGVDVFLLSIYPHGCWKASPCPYRIIYFFHTQTILVLQFANAILGVSGTEKVVYRPPLTITNPRI